MIAVLGKQPTLVPVVRTHEYDTIVPPLVAKLPLPSNVTREPLATVEFDQMEWKAQ
jgi:hypothetical protein